MMCRENLPFYSYALEVLIVLEFNLLSEVFSCESYRIYIINDSTGSSTFQLVDFDSDIFSGDLKRIFLC